MSTRLLVYLLLDATYERLGISDETRVDALLAAMDRAWWAMTSDERYAFLDSQET